MAQRDVFRICIVNPNSNQDMTEDLKKSVESLGYDNTIYSFVTATSSAPYSINNMDDVEHSILPALEAVEKDESPPVIVDAFLVACFSPHPLVHVLSSRFDTVRVLGIFEASIQAAANLCGACSPEDDSRHREYQMHKFGIITTGAVWKAVFDKTIRENFGDDITARYVGTESIGIDAGDLHRRDERGESVEERVRAATATLVDSEDLEYPEEVQAIILGCAGMQGMRWWVKGEARSVGVHVRVIDGVKVGVGMLQAYLRAGA